MLASMLWVFSLVAICAASSALATAGSEASPLRRVAAKGSRHVRMPVQRQWVNGTRGHKHHARRMPLDPLSRRWGWEHLQDLGGVAYVIDLEIGTPMQSVQVILDTGSFELWVNPVCATSADNNLCQSFGTYTPRKSSTSKSAKGKLQVTYGTGAVVGKYWTDTMQIAMTTITKAQFGVADDSNYTYAGILGLGFAYPYAISYPTVMDLMVSNGDIGAPIFSLGLGGEGDGFSEIIFGGVNVYKFAGPLVPVKIWPPISQQPRNWIQYWVNVTSVGMTQAGQTGVIYTDKNSFVMPVIIDTGSTLSYFREDLVATIGQQFNAQIDDSGTYVVDCSWRDKPGSVDFGFNRGAMVINVPFKDFIYEEYTNYCLLGVQPSDAGTTTYILGDTFIRAAYLVFDQQSQVIWMNQYYNCGDGVQDVGWAPQDASQAVGAC